MDSNHTSIINWPYKFYVFLRPLHVLVRSNFQKCMQFVGWLFKRFAETTKMFYVSTHLDSGREIAPNTGANATKFFTLTTKS